MTEDLKMSFYSLSLNNEFHILASLRYDHFKISKLRKI